MNSVVVMYKAAEIALRSLQVAIGSTSHPDYQDALKDTIDGFVQSGIPERLRTAAEQELRDQDEPR